MNPMFMLSHLRIHFISSHHPLSCRVRPQGWYAEAKVWADEKCLRAWEATSMADDAEDVASVKHRMLKDLDTKLCALKERLAG